MIALVGAGCSLAVFNDSADQPTTTAATFFTPTSIVPGVVPDVVSDSQRSATNKVLDAGFVVAEEFAPDPNCGENEVGQVFAQQPTGGTELEPGSTVTVVIVEAPAVVPVEDVRHGDPVGEPIEPTVTLGSDAVWPEPLEQAGSEAVARRFASEVLGWEDLSLMAGGGVVIDGHPTRFTVENDIGSVVWLDIDVFRDDGWGVVDIGEPFGTSAAEQPEGGTRIEFAPCPGVTRVVVHIGDYNGKTRAWHADLTNYIEPRAIVLPDLDERGMASILVLYNDPTGRTLRATVKQFGPS